ncbi:uncharacterized protein B0T15DRAFT_515176 [Chaetomium strumarium]|uniref:Zn(2)-C6 fungal-type domain-containing protein n=1 Tax=Chaetomium strumarium TaxID=1170767 RepID=A0AAJ0M509_9PEZI|nr:hypothetical protein B0T15DRAFT_515176 [Chaetomium strumarium]
MSAFGLPLPPFPTSKRSACNRCRSQKLRCPPREPGSEACSRCIRLGAKCETSYPRPPGRGGGGRTSGSSVSASQLKPKPPPSSVDAIAAGLFLPPTADAGHVAHAAPSVGSVSSQHLHNFAFSLPEDSLDMFGLTPLFDNHIHNLSHNEDPASFLDDVTGAVPPLLHSGDVSSTTWGHGPVDGDRLREDEDQEEQQQDEEDEDADGDEGLGAGTGTSISQLTHVLDCNHRLSALSLDLSRQLRQYLIVASPARTQGGTPTHPEMMVLDQAEESSSTTPEEPLASRLLADALADSAEFLTIIQSYRPEKRRMNNPNTNSSSSSSTSSTSGGPSTPRPGMVVTLHLLVVYLQLVAIYDRLLHLLSDQLLVFHGDNNTTSTSSSDNNNNSSSSNNSSSVYLAGAANQNQIQHQEKTVLPALAQLVSFPSSSSSSTAPASQRRTSSAGGTVGSPGGASLQTKILMHAILHQFETIERLLGLPGEFQVTERQQLCRPPTRRNSGEGGGDGGGIGGGGGGGITLRDAIVSHEGWYDREVSAEDTSGSTTNEKVGVVGLGALASLRGKLRSLQVSLNM